MFEEDDDPVRDGAIQEFLDELVAISIRSAYETIEEMGMDSWIDEVPIEASRKRKIMTRMIQFFEACEEFEKCAFLVKGVKLIDEPKKQVI